MSVSGIGSNTSIYTGYTSAPNSSNANSGIPAANVDMSTIWSFSHENGDDVQNLDELYNKKAQAQEELSDLQSQSNDTQSQINDRTSEINGDVLGEDSDSALQTEYDEAQAEFMEAQAEYDEASAAKDTAQQELNTLNQEQMSNNMAIATNQQELATNAQNLATNAQNLSVNASNIARVNSELSAARSELASLSNSGGGGQCGENGECGQAAPDNSGRISELQGLIASLEAELQQLLAEKAQLEAEKAQLEAEKSQLEAERSQIAADISSTQAEISTQETAMADAQARMDDAQTRMDQAEQEMMALNPELEDSVNGDNELQQLQTEFDEIQKNIENKQKEIDQYDAQIAEAEAKNASLQAARSQEASQAFEKAAEEAGCDVSASVPNAKESVAQKKYGKKYDELTKEEQIGIDAGVKGEITLDVMDKARKMLEENPNNEAAQAVLAKGQQNLDAQESLAAASLNESLNNMPDDMKVGANAAMDQARANARAEGSDTEAAAMQALSQFAEENSANSTLNSKEKAAMVSVVKASASYTDSMQQTDRGLEMSKPYYDEMYGNGGRDGAIHGGHGAAGTQGGWGYTSAPARPEGGAQGGWGYTSAPARPESGAQGGWGYTSAPARPEGRAQGGWGYASAPDRPEGRAQGGWGYTSAPERPEGVAYEGEVSGRDNAVNSPINTVWGGLFGPEFNERPTSLEEAGKIMIEQAKEAAKARAVPNAIYAHNFTSPEAYDAAVKDLGAQGVEITTGEEQREEDMFNSNAILAAAASGMLDYEALAQNMENIEDGSMASYIANTLLEAHNSGKPFEEIDFGVEFSNPFQQMQQREPDTSSPGGMMSGLTQNSYSIFQIYMVDQQSTQSMLGAAQMGILDNEAVSEAAQATPPQEVPQSGGMPGLYFDFALDYIAEAGANGEEVSQESYVQYMHEQQHAQQQKDTEGIKSKQLEKWLGLFDGDVGKIAAAIQSIPPEDADILMLPRTISSSNFSSKEAYDEAVSDLKEKGVEITTDEEHQEEDMFNSNAILAAAASGMLDYEALAENMANIEDGSMAAYIANTLLEAHNSGTPFEEIDFGVEFPRPFAQLPGLGQDQGTPGPKDETFVPGGGLTTAYSIAQIQMTDYQSCQSMLGAAQMGILDMDAVNSASDVYQQYPNSGIGSHMDETLAYIADTGANGEQISKESYEKFLEEQRAAQPEFKPKSLKDLLAGGLLGGIGGALGSLNLSDEMLQMYMTDYQTSQAIVQNMQRNSLRDKEGYDETVEELKSQGVEITTDEEQQAEDLQSTEAILAAASAGVLDYDALRASLEEAGEGSLSAYVSEKLLAAHDAGIPVEEIDFGSERLHTTDPIYNLPEAQQGGMMGGTQNAYSTFQMYMTDQQESQGLLQAAQLGIVDQNALNVVIEQNAQNGGNSNTMLTMEYISAMAADGAEMTNESYEQFIQDHRAVTEVDNKQASDLPGSLGGMMSGLTQNAYSVAQIYMTDQQNTQKVLEDIQHATIRDMDGYADVVADLKAQGIEITTDEEHQAEDLESTQAMLAAASAGVLDYDALKASLEEAGEGSLSAYVGEKLIAAHDAGVPVEEIEFNSDLIHTNKPVFDLPEANQGGMMGGTKSAYSVFQIYMIDQQESQGLLQAAQLGLIDQNALNIVIEQNAQSNSNTVLTMEYISTMAAEGAEVSTENYEQFIQDHRAVTEVEEKEPSHLPAAMDNMDSVLNGMTHTSYSVYQIYMTDQQNAQKVLENIQHATIRDMDGYAEVVADLKSQGIEITTDEEHQEEDLESTQAMMAAASAGVLDYDALKASLEEAGEGSLSAYIGEKLIAAHDAGVPVEEIEFDSELIRTNPPMYELPEMQSAGSPGGMMGGLTQTSYAVFQIYMTDQQESQGLIQAAEQGLIDQNALNIIIEQNAQNNNSSVTLKTMEYISETAASGAEINAEDYENFLKEHAADANDDSTPKLPADIVEGLKPNSSVMAMYMADLQNSQKILENISKSAIKNQDDYAAVVDDLKAHDVEITTDEEHQEEDLESTQAMLAAASAGILNYDALKTSLAEAGEGSLAAYVGEKLIAAHDAGVPVQEIEFDSELINTPLPVAEIPADQPGGIMGGMVKNSYSIFQMQMIDQQTSQGLIMAAQQGLVDQAALGTALAQNIQSSGTATAMTMEYIYTTSADGGDVSAEGCEQFIQDHRAVASAEDNDAMDQQPQEFYDNKGRILESLGVFEGVEQMKMADMQRAQHIMDDINKSYINGLEGYSDVVADLKAKGIEITTDEAHQAEDLESTQAMLAAASAGILDYNALELSLAETDKGSLSAYIGQKLIDANAAGIPIQDIEFDSELINTNKPVFELPENTGNGGLTGSASTAYAVFQIQMTDMQASQGLMQAAQHGYIDQNALGDLVEQNAQLDGTASNTAKTMEYIFNTAAEGGEISAESYEQYQQNKIKEAAQDKFNAGMFTDHILTGGSGDDTIILPDKDPDKGGRGDDTIILPGKPEPLPMPFPEPGKPEPRPIPMPEPRPMPFPDPGRPEPRPIPMPEPRPMPFPDPGRPEPRPIPMPEPKPMPFPEPGQLDPKPRPIPMPNPGDIIDGGAGKDVIFYAERD